MAIFGHEVLASSGIPHPATHTPVHVPFQQLGRQFRPSATTIGSAPDTRNCAAHTARTDRTSLAPCHSGAAARCDRPAVFHRAKRLTRDSRRPARRSPLTWAPCTACGAATRPSACRPARRWECAIETARHAAFQFVFETVVPAQELSSLRCKPRPRDPTSSPLPLQEVKPSSPLQVPQISPGVPVGHLELLHRLLDRAQLVNEAE
jgi:hypothetical protein